MKIIVNHDHLIPDETWQRFYKVRAVIENENGEFILSHEAGKHIFPGGSKESGETDLEAIKREIQEETGIEFADEDFHKVLELETLYKNVYNYRTSSFSPRYTKTIYYYVKCNRKIDASNMNLTDEEISQKFKIAFVSKERLIQLLSEDHSNAINGSIFDEENKIIIDNIIKKELKVDKEDKMKR